jgi:acyl-CoA thioesterase YciA
MEESKNRPPETEPALRAIAMPADANPNGDIFSGWLLSQTYVAIGSDRRPRPVPAES